MSGQHHDIPPRKEPLGSSEQKAGWAPDQVWKSQGKKSFVFAGVRAMTLAGRPTINMASFHLIKCLLLQEMFQAELVYHNKIIFRLPKTSLNAKLHKKRKIGRPNVRWFDKVQTDIQTL